MKIRTFKWRSNRRFCLLPGGWPFFLSGLQESEQVSRIAASSRRAVFFLWKLFPGAKETNGNCASQSIKSADIYRCKDICSNAQSGFLIQNTQNILRDMIQIEFIGRTPSYRSRVSVPMPCSSSFSSSLLRPLLLFWPLRLAIQLSRIRTRNFLIAAWRCWRNGDDSLFRFKGRKYLTAAYSTSAGGSLVFGLQQIRLNAAKRTPASRDDKASLSVTKLLSEIQYRWPFTVRWALMIQTHARRCPGAAGSRAASSESNAPGKQRRVQGRR